MVQAQSEPRTQEPISVLLAPAGLSPARVALGRRLFHDPAISRDRTVSCASCHQIDQGGDDGRRVSVGVAGRSGEINAPTVVNAGLLFKQFWDGRAETLEDQIDGPIQNVIEMDMLWPEVIARLYEKQGYVGAFEDAFGAPVITRANTKAAIADFVRSLVSTGGPFDRWLQGDDGALTSEELEGYRWFKHYGCTSCHHGRAVGGNMFQRFGVVNDYFEQRPLTRADLGRFNVTRNPLDRHAFKVPSLRMVEHTAPYLHDGSAATLRDAVDAMFRFQLGRTAPDVHKERIVAFLRTLDGPVSTDLAAVPEERPPAEAVLAPVEAIPAPPRGDSSRPPAGAVPAPPREDAAREDAAREDAARSRPRDAAAPVHAPDAVAPASDTVIPAEPARRSPRNRS